MVLKEAKLNLFRFFLIKSLSLLKEGGRFGMIVPLSLIGDVSCAQTRNNFFSSLYATKVDCFPQKDDRYKRVFYDAKLSTCIVIGEHSTSIEKTLDSNILLRVHNKNFVDKDSRTGEISINDVRALDPRYLPIPLSHKAVLEIFSRIYSQSNVCYFFECEQITINRGEI